MKSQVHFNLKNDFMYPKLSDNSVILEVTYSTIQVHEK
jgi:hypothetical protein